MGVYDNMQGVPGFGRSGAYTEEGTYEIVIEHLFLKSSAKPEKKGELLIICEWKFAKSDNEKHKAGSFGSVARTISPDPYGYTANDVIRLVYAAVKALDLGMPEPETFDLSKKVATAISDPDPAARAKASAELKALEIEDAAEFIKGARVALEVKKGPTKKNPNVLFSYHNFAPVTP